MSRRHELEHHRRSLGEIREIMNAMKNLAYMETRKLARFIDAQQAVVNNIETTAADFLTFHGDQLPEPHAAISVYVLIGTERGFCGDINQKLLEQFEAALRHTKQTTPPQLIVIGHKLHLLTEKDARVTAMIPGASIAEEVPAVLQQLVEALTHLQQSQGVATLFGLYHGGEDGIVMNRLLPPFQTLHKEITFSQPPVLNLPAKAFLLELTDHYLFAALNEMLYTSLVAENRRRVAHLEGAIQHLDEETTELAHRSNALRQEEITEEIEVILLSADRSAP